MKTLIILSLFVLCAFFAAFSQYEETVNQNVTDAEFQKFFNGYNPDFKSKGIVKSAFKHEVVYNK